MIENVDVHCSSPALPGLYASISGSNLPSLSCQGAGHRKKPRLSGSKCLAEWQMTPFYSILQDKLSSSFALRQQGLTMHFIKTMAMYAKAHVV